MKISDIDVGIRHRHDLGDIGSLVRSIQEVGLLHPVVVAPDGVLIAGERRLEACRLLGWDEVPVTVVPLDDIVKGEFAENSERKDFLPSEIDAIRRAMEPVEKAAAKGRQGTRTDLLVSPEQEAKGYVHTCPVCGEVFDKPVWHCPTSGCDHHWLMDTNYCKNCGEEGDLEESFLNVTKAEKKRQPQTRDKIGAFAGVSGRTVEKIAEVVAAAEKNPEEFGGLVEEMDRTGKVGGAHRKLKQARDEKRILGITPIVGTFKTLVIDPPWDYGDLSLAGRAAPIYNTMSHDELLALDVEGWADENCHMYLWTTNNFIPLAVELMACWGFQHKTVLTWVKPRWGLGSYFRNSTEQVLFGVRGELRTRSDSIATHFEAQMGEHSEKPEEFYEIVRKASYPPYGEVFQRTDRPDFRNVFKDGDDE